jgi:hypothetical protein
MLASAIRDAAAGRFSDSAFVIYTSAEWLEYVNDRYNEVWGASPDWPFKRQHLTPTVTVNTRASSALASGTWKVESVLDATNDNRLRVMYSSSDLARIDPAEDSTGVPSLYRLYGNTIEVWPMPQATVTLHVDALIQATDLAAGDTPSFPSQYHRMLVDGALAMAYADDGNQAMAKLYEDKFVKKLEQMKSDLLGHQEEGSHVVQDDYWT